MRRIEGQFAGVNGTRAKPSVLRRKFPQDFYGLFGNDGLYLESKISLKTPFQRWALESCGGYLFLAGAVVCTLFPLHNLRIDLNLNFLDYLWHRTHVSSLMSSKATVFAPSPPDALQHSWYALFCSVSLKSNLSGLISAMERTDSLVYSYPTIFVVLSPVIMLPILIE